LINYIRCGFLAVELQQASVSYSDHYLDVIFFITGTTYARKKCWQRSSKAVEIFPSRLLSQGDGWYVSHVDNVFQFSCCIQIPFISQNPNTFFGIYWHGTSMYNFTRPWSILCCAGRKTCKLLSGLFVCVLSSYGSQSSVMEKREPFATVSAPVTKSLPLTDATNWLSLACEFPALEAVFSVPVLGDRKSEVPP